MSALLLGSQCVSSSSINYLITQTLQDYIEKLLEDMSQILSILPRSSMKNLSPVSASVTVQPWSAQVQMLH